MISCRGIAGPKKNPCPDCTFCQWCSDSRCNVCRPDNKCCRTAAPGNKSVKKKSGQAKKKVRKKIKA